MIDVLLKLLRWAALNVREVPKGSNGGERVESVQRWGGGRKGDAWCAFFVYWVGSLAAIVSGGYWPLPRTGSTQALLDYATAHELLVEIPRAGDVFILLNAQGRAEHTGFVVAFHVSTFDEIAGNTTQVTGSREGWGCFENTRTMGPRYRFVRWLNAPPPQPAPQ